MLHLVRLYTKNKIHTVDPIVLEYSAFSGYCYCILTFSVPGAWPWPRMVVFGASGRSRWLHAVFFSVMNWGACSGQVDRVITCLQQMNMRKKVVAECSMMSYLYTLPLWTISLRQQSANTNHWNKTEIGTVVKARQLWSKTYFIPQWYVNSVMYFYLIWYILIPWMNCLMTVVFLVSFS